MTSNLSSLTLHIVLMRIARATLHNLLTIGSVEGIVTLALSVQTSLRLLGSVLLVDTVRERIWQTLKSLLRASIKANIVL